MKTVMRQFVLFSVAIICVSAQSGPEDALSGPASATTADLVNDPTGVLHLKVRLEDNARAWAVKSFCWLVVQRDLELTRESPVNICAGTAHAHNGLSVVLSRHVPK